MAETNVVRPGPTKPIENPPAQVAARDKLIIERLLMLQHNGIDVSQFTVDELEELGHLNGPDFTKYLDVHTRLHPQKQADQFEFKNEKFNNFKDLSVPSLRAWFERRGMEFAKCVNHDLERLRTEREESAQKYNMGKRPVIDPRCLGHMGDTGDISDRSFTYILEGARAYVPSADSFQTLSPEEQKREILKALTKDFINPSWKKIY